MKLIVAVVFALLGFTGLAPLSRAVDLKTIDRAVKKEPKYTSQPRYGLLVFGPEAKTKVWLVLDGAVLYVDRNGNGDLTEAGERVEPDAEATKGLTFVGGEAYTGLNLFALGEIAGVRLRLDHRIRNEKFTPKDDFDKQRLNHGWEIASLCRVGKDGSLAQTPILFCPKPEDAQVSHLSGPLEFALKWGNKQSLKITGQEQVFDINIGTPGLATRHSPFPVFSPLTPEDVPADVHPVAVFEFPNKDPKQPSIKLTVKLDRRCCGDTFYCPLRVPSDVGTGLAKVFVAFPDWKDGRVAPAKFEIPVIGRPPRWRWPTR